MRDNNTIEVEYFATAKDYRRVLLWYRWKRLAAVIVFAALVAIPILYSSFSGDASMRPPGWVLWFLIILPLLVLAVFWWGISRQADNIEKVFEPVKVIFSEKGMESTGESSSAEMGWDDFYKIYETRQDLIFFPERSIFYTIPKRFFKEPDKISVLRNLLKNKLGSRAKLQK